MRLAVVFTKEAPVRFVSHLDLQRLFQRAFRRAKPRKTFADGAILRSNGLDKKL